MATQSSDQKTSARVRDLVDSMTLEQKVAQLVGYWVDRGTESVAPMQGAMVKDDSYLQVSENGLGHLTRVYGTRPVDPVQRSQWLEQEQLRIRQQSGVDVAALVHEECLTGLAAWQATTYPIPLAWGATFDPLLIEKMGSHIGRDMATLGIHQGLAPVLDVIRDPRWGRVEECISEDPYVVGTIGTAYVEGLQSAGVDATLKHFLGYSASTAGRNHAPVQAGQREIAEVFLPPFEMAIIDGAAASVMNSYAAIDGVPVASDPKILTELLREQLEFEGVVVADYFAVAFLRLMQQVAANNSDAATQALTAGIDVELPSADAYPELVELVREGALPERYVDRALIRVLNQKEKHGLIGGSGNPIDAEVDLDSEENRALARQISEQSIILLSNNGVLPLKGSDAKIAVVGPNADSFEALMGCYSFVNHVLAHHPGVESGIQLPTVLEALRSRVPSDKIVYAKGCDVESAPGEDQQEFDHALAVGAEADIIVMVGGDRAGLFGRGTVGEGNDVDSLDLPGRQLELAKALCDLGKPVILVLLSGRPYHLDWALDAESAPAAVVQAFFPGEEGGQAIAEVLTGSVNPSGRLPVTLPNAAGAQPFTYMHPPLGGATEISSLDPTPVRPFGFGLSYTEFEHSDLDVASRNETSDDLNVSVTVKNSGQRAGTDVVQLYGHDLVGSVTRPVAQLLAYQRVTLEPGESARVTFTLPPSRLSLIDRSLNRVVEPGEWDLWVGHFVDDREVEARIELVGSVHDVALRDPRRSAAKVEVLP